MNPKVFIDCGAPSLYNKLSRVNKGSGGMGASFSQRKYDDYSYTQTKEYKQYREDYIRYIHNNMERIYVYSNLDVINNPKETLENQRILESNGLTPIPVFHLGNNIRWLKMYVDKYDYIAIGGLKRTTTSMLIKTLDSIWKEVLLDGEGNPKVKVHGFANTSWPLMKKYPWYSVDSATCRKLGAFGNIIVPAHSTDKLHIVSVSSRDVELKYKLSKGVVRELNRRAERYDTSIKELSEVTIMRMVWNYFMFLENIEKIIPKWPWNYYTRKSLPGANESLDFYIAGEFSGKEEIEMWRRFNIAKKGETGHRLISFYYNKKSLPKTLPQ